MKNTESTPLVPFADRVERSYFVRARALEILRQGASLMTISEAMALAVAQLRAEGRAA